MVVAQINKELLLKHRFWILLAIFLILWIASMAILQTSAAAPLAKKKSDYDTAKKNIENAAKKQPKNDNFVEPWRIYGKYFADQKATVWKDAWNLQKDMIIWPSSATAPFQERWRAAPNFAEFLKGLGEESHDQKGWRTALARSEYKDVLYDSQFNDLESQVKPVVLNGDVFQRVDWKKLPLIEELWLAQEDLWVRKELLHIFRSALDSVAQFEHVPLTEKDTVPPGGFRYRFRNGSWELDLLVEQHGKALEISPQSRIKNVHVTKRTLRLANPRTNKPLAFRLRQGSSNFLLHVEGEPLAAGQSAPFLKAASPESLNLKRQFDVEQVFDWDNCPVRRIDALQLAVQSHRTASKPLKPNPILSQADRGGAAPGATPGATPTPVPATTSAGGPGIRGGRSGAGDAPGGATAAGSADVTPNGLKKNRYLHLTEQCRHMPIGLLAVVDQANIHDVLIAVANSRLRIQITQVAFNHIQGVAPPPEDAEPAPEPRNQRNTAKGATRKGQTATSTPSPTSTAVAGEDDPNLVELAVYGIATLYERFPDAPPAKDGAPGTAPAGSTTQTAPNVTQAPAGAGAPAGKAPAAAAPPAEKTKGAAPKGTETKGEAPKAPAPKGDAPKAENKKS